MPPVPAFCKCFVTVRHQPEANGLLVALYVVTLDQFQEVGLILFDCVHEMYEPRRSCIFWYKSFASVLLIRFITVMQHICLSGFGSGL